MNDTYILITPVYNEELYLEKTIQSVLSQSILPRLWILVDDDSSDSSLSIIQKYAGQYPWITYAHRQKDQGQTYYASNVHAIYEGLSFIKDLEYEYLGILDADISLPKDYYEVILKRMQADPKLGIASGVYMDNVKGKMRKILNDRRSTPKAIMVFRRKCYDEIGGFVPMKYGGEDTIACFTARMKGWKSWSFSDVVAIHNKPVGTGHARDLLKIRFRQGIGEYFLATHPLFFFLKSMRRCVKEPPLFIGGLCRIMGFVYAHGIREKRQLSQEIIQYIYKEQIQRVFSGNKIPRELKVNEVNEKG